MSVAASKWSASPPIILGAVTVAIIVVGIGLWTTLGKLSGAVVAQGQIILAQSSQVIQHPEGGVVEAIFVTEGSSVKWGGLLMRIKGDELKSELHLLENRQAELSAIHSRLQAQIDDASAVEFVPEVLLLAEVDGYTAGFLQTQSDLFDQKKAEIDLAKSQRRYRIDNLRSQLFAIFAQQDSIDTQIDLHNEHLEAVEKLQLAGVVTSEEILAIKLQIADHEAESNQLQAQIAALTGQIAQLNIELTSVGLQYRSDTETELRSTLEEKEELDVKVKDLRHRVKALEIRAPIAGIVLGLQVTRPQAVVRPAETLMYVVPQSGPFLVEARVSVTDVDEVHVGQEVRIVMNRDAAGNTPELIGSVNLISADALKDERTGAPYFQVTVAIPMNALKKLPDLHLVPGMQVSVYMRTTDRTPLDYLLKPFTDYFRNAMRET